MRIAVAPERDLPSRPEGRGFGVPKRREEIVKLLTDAYAGDDLEQRDFEQRLERAEQARTIEELDAIVDDFPPEVVRGEVGRPSATDPAVGLSGKALDAEVQRLDAIEVSSRVGIFGDKRVIARPSDERVVQFAVLFGDTVVDLRQLAGTGGAYLVKISTGFGDTRVIVPPGTDVQARHVSVIGDQRHKKKTRGSFLNRLARTLGAKPDSTETEALPGPTVVITGFKLIGDVKIIEEAEP